MFAFPSLVVVMCATTVVDESHLVQILMRGVRNQSPLALSHAGIGPPGDVAVDDCMFDSPLQGRRNAIKTGAARE